ncbi:MAG: hypothetical protein HZB18_15500 [Chloroflexi bacterium]|nr:hypothetical protein [Chloroflexota bacterium]
MALALDTQPAPVNISSLEYAILETLAYSDIFEHPLTIDELHRFLTMSATKEEVRECVEKMDGVVSSHEYYFLADRADMINIVAIRNQRRENSRKAYHRALFYGRILGRLPFIRMAALTGSLAMLNLSKNMDMDYMLVAKPGRVWTARAFALLFGRLARLFGDVICPNVIVSENALEWNVRNMYAAREFAQMIPVCGFDVFGRMLSDNLWVNDFLPNLPLDSDSLLSKEKGGNFIFQSILEYLLNGKLGNLFEPWEMSRKIARFKKQKGYGAETNFSADLCQGNFDHHGSWALKAYEERLKALFPSPSPEGEGSPFSLRERVRVRAS